LSDREQIEVRIDKDAGETWKVQRRSIIPLARGLSVSEKVSFRMIPGSKRGTMRRKSLIVKLGAIGDVASLIPAVWKLHQSGSEIDWLCGKVVAPLLSCYTWIRPITVNDGVLFGGRSVEKIAEILRVWRKLMGASYALCAILQYDRRYKALVVPVHARKTILLSRQDRAFRLVSERHHTAEFARILLEEPDGYREENLAPVSPDLLPDNPLPGYGKIRIALAPGGARNLLNDDAQRRWPVQSYVELAGLLINKGYEVVLTGGPGDVWAEAHFAGLGVVNCIGHWKIPQTIAFYRSCDCMVSHDSGPMHLAGISGCNLIALFGPTAPSKALPRRDGIVSLWGGEHLPCRPCYDGNTFADCKWNGCLISITPQRVAAQIESMIRLPKAEWQVINV
jgi:heptosyltransferase-2